MFEKIDSGIFDGIQYEFCRNFSSLFFCGWGTAAELLSHEAIFVLRNIFVSLLAELHTLGTKKQKISIFEEIFVFARTISYVYLSCSTEKGFYRTNV